MAISAYVFSVFFDFTGFQAGRHGKGLEEAISNHFRILKRLVTGCGTSRPASVMN